MPRNLDRMSEAEMLEAAARGVGRIDRDGDRGVTMVSKEEIWAMAMTLVCLGLIPIPPGACAPDQPII